MVLLDEGASLCESSAWTLLGWYCWMRELPCECHVIDDTPCFLAGVIPPPPVPVTIELQIHF